jgi:hypothetical protein
MHIAISGPSLDADKMGFLDWLLSIFYPYVGSFALRHGLPFNTFSEHTV